MVEPDRRFSGYAFKPLYIYPVTQDKINRILKQAIALSPNAAVKAVFGSRNS